MYIVTHPGHAHRDDLLACGTVQALYGPMVIYRRQPTAAEIHDPQVWVLDVGEVHDHEARCYDHHQLKRDAAPACALSLLAEDLGVAPALKLASWYTPTALIDSKGPFATAKSLGLGRFPFELMSPIEEVLLAMFAEQQIVHPEEPLGRLIEEIGRRLLEQYQELAGQVDDAARTVQVDAHDGVQILAWDAPIDSQVSGLVRTRHYPGAAILVAPDDRGDGWTLYRYDDHPRVDFTRCDADHCVFQHVGGFVAKTRKMPLNAALDLVRQAIK